MKTKMSLVVSLFVTVIILLLALSALWYFNRELKDTIYKQQFTLVSSMAEEIDNKILNAQMELIAVAGIATSDLAQNPRQAQKFLDNRVGIRTIFDSGIYIFSPDGRLTATSPAELRLQGKDYSLRDYIRNTILSGKPQISAPFFSMQSDQHPVIMFTAPFFNAKGNMTGILAGALDLMRDNFLGKLATVKLGDKGYLYLYSTDRTMIVHPDRTRILRRDVPLGANRLFDRAIEGFEGTGETVTSRGLHALSSFKRLKSTNWILAANYPQAEAYATIYRAKWYLLGAAVVALILSNLLVWWFMRHLTAPLLLFTSHVKRITGREIETEPISISSRDEIGTLAQAFNEMLAEMEAHKMAIRKQKEFSENLLLNSAIPTFVLDTRHRVIIWNKACEELTGMKAAEILGTTGSWKAFYRKERTVLADVVIDGNIGDLPQFYDSFNKSPFTPDGLQAEGWCSTATNCERYVFFDAAPVRNAEGEIVAVIETVLDITERRRAEEGLRNSEAQYRFLTENMKDVVWILDTETMYIRYISPSVEKLRGFTPEEVMSVPIVNAMAPGSRDGLLGILRNRLNDFLAGKLSSDEYYTFEMMQPRKDGSVVWVEANAKFQLNKKTGHVEVHGVSRDISARKKAEEVLKESEHRYRGLVELSPEAIYIHTGGKLIFANTEGAKLLGAERPDELYGREALDFVHPDNRDFVQQRISNAFRNGVPNPPIEELFVRLDGSPVPVEVASVPYTYHGENSLQVIARDITERKRVEERTEKGP